MHGFLRRVTPSWAAARPFLIICLILVFVFSFFFWQLGSMTPGLGPEEYQSRHNSQELEQIVKHGINAPYYLLQYGLLQIFSDQIIALRLASIITALAIFSFLYLLFRSWFGQTVAVFAALIFIATPWAIVASRTATPSIMLIWPIVVIACFILMSRSKRRSVIWWLLLAIALGLGLYIPGVAWLFLLAIPVFGSLLSDTSRRIRGIYLVLGMTTIILLVAPLALALALEPSLIKQLLLIPDELPSGVAMLESVGWNAASFFWRTKEAVDIGISHLPILSILQIVLVGFGLYALSSRSRSITYTLGGIWFFAILASAVNEDPHLLLLGLPAVAVFMAAGLRYLYIEWKKVFPLNPFAYGLAFTLIALVVSAQLLYAARYALIAWPHTSETKTTYVLK